MEVKKERNWQFFVNAIILRKLKDGLLWTVVKSSLVSSFKTKVLWVVILASSYKLLIEMVEFCGRYKFIVIEQLKQNVNFSGVF